MISFWFWLVLNRRLFSFVITKGTGNQGSGISWSRTKSRRAWRGVAADCEVGQLSSVLFFCFFLRSGFFDFSLEEPSSVPSFDIFMVQQRP
jgi:hypothetical protein